MSAEYSLPSETIVADLENLRHMLGIASNTKPRDYGYRNYFNTSADTPDGKSMQRLVDLGLVVRNQRNGDYWHATEAGCKAVGLNDKQTRKALNDE